MIILIFIIAGFILPESFQMPVQSADGRSYAQNSFWFYPWGKSVTHKGVDIFAKRNTPVFSSTNGIVIYTGQLSMGGNVVLVLGPKWRTHYCAHLETVTVSLFTPVSHQTELGKVGSSGNAKGKPPHLHYSIRTLVPYPWQADASVQGWKKMYYLNPVSYLNQSLVAN
jgi:murein DD-endopeptidase MepM/ murein hydrolase activator NlpD